MSSEHGEWRVESAVGSGAWNVARVRDVDLVALYRDYLRAPFVGRRATLAEFVGVGGVTEAGMCGSDSCGEPRGGLLGSGSRLVQDSCDGVAGSGVVGDRGDSAGGIENRVTVDEGCTGVCTGVLSGFGDKAGSSSSAASDKWSGLTGRARRKARRRAKDVSGVHGKSSEVVEEIKVPEWRVKSPAGPVHRGYFSECSEQQRVELRETRAAMLIAKNKADAAKAEVEATRCRAQVRSREVERQAELRRVETDVKMKAAVESRFGVGYSSGFAKTVVEEGLSDVIPVPSLSRDSSISPDSSVSVEMVHRMEQTIEKLSGEVVELRKANEVMQARIGASVGVDEKLRGRMDVTTGRAHGVSLEDELDAYAAMAGGPPSSYHDGLTGAGSSVMELVHRACPDGF